MQPDETVVVVPERTAMAEEPALTIGEIFKNKAMIKTLVVAVIGILASFGVTVIDGVADYIVDIVYIVAMLATAGTAQVEARQRAETQAAATREKVYAPATTLRIAEAAARTGKVTAKQAELAA